MNSEDVVDKFHHLVFQYSYIRILKNEERHLKVIGKIVAISLYMTTICGQADNTLLAM